MTDFRYIYILICLFLKDLVICIIKIFALASDLEVSGPTFTTLLKKIHFIYRNRENLFSHLFRGN